MPFYISGKWSTYILGNRTFKPSAKKLKNATLERFLIFQEMEISSSKIEKILRFWKMELSSPKLKKLTQAQKTKKSFLHFLL